MPDKGTCENWKAEETSIHVVTKEVIRNAGHGTEQQSADIH